jgi:hypothetical protein
VESGERRRGTLKTVTSDKHDAFRHTLHEIHERIKMFVLVKTKH